MDLVRLCYKVYKVVWVSNCMGLHVCACSLLICCFKKFSTECTTQCHTPIIACCILNKTSHLSFHSFCMRWVFVQSSQQLKLLLQCITEQNHVLCTGWLCMTARPAFSSLLICNVVVGAVHADLWCVNTFHWVFMWTFCGCLQWSSWWRDSQRAFSQRGSLSPNCWAAELQSCIVLCG